MINPAVRLVVPDVHEHLELLDKIDRRFPILPRIWLGDWWDQFDNDRGRVESTTMYLKLRMEEHPDDIFLLGNHDWHYSEPGVQTPSGVTGYCAGYAAWKYRIVRDSMPERWHQRFEIYTEYGGYLLSHAGFNFDPTVDNPDIPVNEWPWMVGRARGGRFRWGGPLWLDWDEEFTGFYAGIHSKCTKAGQMVPQIVGHTPHHSPRMWHGSLCLDTHLQHVGLLSVTGRLEIIKL